MNTPTFARPLRLPFSLAATSLAVALASGCTSLLPKPPPQPAFYSLDAASTPRPAPTRELRALVPTLIVNPPRAAAGFDSQRIIYTRQSHRLEYFAHSEWADTPARMLAPLIVAALAATPAFGAVVTTASAANGDLRLDTEIVRLQQDFSTQPSRVRFTLRAVMVDNATRRVLAWREFDETVAATTDDPPGGVLAAHGAVQAVLGPLSTFCAEAAGGWLNDQRLQPAPNAAGATRSSPR